MDWLWGKHNQQGGLDNGANGLLFLGKHKTGAGAGLLYEISSWLH